MEKLSSLFSYTLPEEILDKCDKLSSSIDTVLTSSQCDEDVLLIMKTLLNDLKVCTSMSDYIEEGKDG